MISRCWTYSTRATFAAPAIRLFEKREQESGPAPVLRDQAVHFLGVLLVVGHQVVEREVAGRVGINLQGACRVARVDHRRQLLILDGHELGGVLRRCHGLGDHRRDGLPDVRHLLAGERRSVRHDQLEPVAAGHGRVARHVADARHVLGGEHGQHFRRLGGLARVHRLDAGMGVRRAHEIGIGKVRRLGVVDVAAKAPQQLIILDAYGAVCAHVLLSGKKPGSGAN